MKQPEQNESAQQGRPLTAFEDCNREMLLRQANAYVAALHGLNRETPQDSWQALERRSQQYATHYDVT